MDVDPSRRVDWLEIELSAVIDNALEAPEMMYRQYQLQTGYAVEDQSDLIIPPNASSSNVINPVLRPNESSGVSSRDRNSVDGLTHDESMTNPVVTIEDDADMDSLNDTHGAVDAPLVLVVPEPQQTLVYDASMIPEAQQTLGPDQHPKDDDDDEAPPKRRRKHGKQHDPNIFYDVGFAVLMPKVLRLPLIMGCIISAMLAFTNNLGWSTQPLDCLEVFSGVESIVWGFEELGMRAAGFDRDTDVQQDIEKPWGMVLLTWMMHRVRPQGLIPWATPCSTWTIVNRGTSQRSEHNPRGFAGHPSVALANLVVSRMTVLLIWCTLLGHQWLLEQPASSLMRQQTRFAQFLWSTTYYTIPTCMGCCGKSTLKGTILLGSSRWMSQLHRSAAQINPAMRQRIKEESKHVTSTSIDQTTSKKKCCGGPSLKKTQEYTKEYGLEVATLFQNNDTDGMQSVSIHDDGGIPDRCNTTYDATDLWQDAQLEEVFAYARDQAMETKAAKQRQARPVFH